MVVVIGFCALYSNYYKVDDIDSDVEDVFIVEDRYDSYSIINKDDLKVFIYNNDNDFKEGNKILFKGKLENITHTYNTFYSYLNKKNINYKLNYTEYEIIDNHVNYNYFLKEKLLDNKENNEYLRLILFNEKNEMNEDLYGGFSLYFLTYMIAVSGFHINVILNFFKKILKSNILGYVFVGFYLFLLKFSVSSYRAFLYKIIKSFARKYDLDLSRVDILSIIGIVFIIVNPSVMFSYAFIFSFLSSFIIEICNVYSKNKLFMSFCIYLVNIPLTLLMNYKLNLFSLLFSLILSFPVSILYTLSFIYLFFNKIGVVYGYAVKMFINFFEWSNEFNVEIIFGKPSVIFVIIYFIFLLAFFVYREKKENKQYVFLSLVFVSLFYLYFKPIIIGNEQLYFLNVGQGDCIAFVVPHSKSAVLVDTGGNKYKDVAKRKIIPFLESKGINKIEKVIISHDDFDHNGALESLKNNFSVEEVVSDSSIKEVYIGSEKFINLNVNGERDNDGSIVLYGEYAGYTVLLTGDISSEIENSISNMIDKVDILKVAHHGSASSTSEFFVKSINARFAIISVGYNTYGHPSDRVLSVLEKYQCYVLRTDENNDIGFYKNIFNWRLIDYFK